MIKQIFTVYDLKSEAYLQPFFLDTKGQAIRTFTDCANDQNHQFGRHPEDYSLFDLGEYDDNAAKFKLYKSPKHIINALETIKTN